MNKTPKICIVTGCQLPIPDVMGGAVERLVTLLIEDNEKYGDYEFTVVTVYNYKACDLQKNFYNTHFVNIRYPQRIINFLQWRYKYLVERITKRAHPYLAGANRQIDKFLMKHGGEFDLIVNECADSLSLLRVAKKYGKNKLCRHFHYVEPPIVEFDSIYGSTISISNYVRKHFLTHSIIPYSRNYLLYNCIDEKRFNNRINKEDVDMIRRTFGFEKKDFIVLYCGRIIQEKGVKELIEAIKKVNDSHVKLLIIGASNFGDNKCGVYEKDVQNLLKSMGEKVRFTGYLDNSLLYKYHQIANVIAIPSVCEEGFGLVLAESLISGTPQIATISGGMPEIGFYETTMFVHKDHRLVRELADAILILKTNPKKLQNMRVACSERAKMFYRDNYYKTFSSIVSNILF